MALKVSGRSRLDIYNLKGITVRTRQLLSSLSLALLLSAGVAQAQAVKKPLVDNTFPMVKPESVGFSSKTLSELDNPLKDIVDKGHLSGVVTMLHVTAKS